MSSLPQNASGARRQGAATEARFSFSIYEFARRHGLSAPTVYNEIYRGDLPAMRVGKGGSLRITTVHEAEWMQRRAFKGKRDVVNTDEELRAVAAVVNRAAGVASKGR